MWYIAAPAALASFSATSAMVTPPRGAPRWGGETVEVPPFSAPYGTLLPPGFDTPPLVGISSPPRLPALNEFPGSPP